MAALAALEVKDVLTVAISVVALVLSFWTALRASRLGREQLRITKRQGEAENLIGAAQAEQAREQTRLTRDSDIIRWAGETLTLLSEMSEMPVTEWEAEDRSHRWHGLRHRLSAQIDIGRFFFPNWGEDRVNPQNPAAFRGHRQPVLDRLVNAYQIFDEAKVTGDMDSRRACKQALVRERREFVSEVQVHIDPRRHIAVKDDDPIEAIKAEVAAERAQEAPKRP